MDVGPSIPLLEGEIEQSSAALIEQHPFKRLGGQRPFIFLRRRRPLRRMKTPMMPNTQERM